jgi:hypothetical protein
VAIGSRSRKPERKALYLKAVEEHLELVAAEKATGISRRTVYDWRKADPEFDAAIEEAQARAVEELVASAFERAMNHPDPKTGKRPFDERTAALLTMFIIKAHRPQFKDSSPRAELNFPDKFTFTFEVPHPPGLLPSARIINQLPELAETSETLADQ